MEYHKDQFDFTDRMEYLQAPLAVQASHQWLIRFCARRESSGIISSSRGWADRQWGIATNGQLKTKDVAAVITAGLAAYRGDDLEVYGYDLSGQEECLRNRKKAKDWRGKRNGNGDNNGIDIGSRTGTVTVREQIQSKPDQSKPDQSLSHDPLEEPNDDDQQRLKFIRSLGGYMEIHGDDKRLDWLNFTQGLTFEQIREVFDYGRKSGKIITLPGKGAGYFGGVREAMRAAQRAARAKETERIEAEARREQERRESSGKAEEARKIESAHRARVGGILSVFDEDPARWITSMSATGADKINQLREIYNKQGRLSLIARFLESLPGDLVTAGEARGREVSEHTEGVVV